ncbi:MAG: glycosyltransferase, partial [Leucobacter sp.]
DGGTDVEYTVSAAQSDSPIVSLSTGVGGALVTTTVLETRVEKQTGTYQPKAVGAFAALSGLSGRQSSMVSTVAHQLLFFVPSGKSGEEIQLLGYTTELVEATN